MSDYYERLDNLRFKLRHNVYRSQQVLDGRDELGNIKWKWVREAIPVAGWAVPQSTEPKMAGHDRLVVDLEIFAPLGTFSPNDEVEIDGYTQKFRLIGHGEDYSANPFGWNPGLAVYNAQYLG